MAELDYCVQYIVKNHHLLTEEQVAKLDAVWKLYEAKPTLPEKYSCLYGCSFNCGANLGEDCKAEFDAEGKQIVFVQELAVELPAVVEAEALTEPTNKH